MEDMQEIPGSDKWSVVEPIDRGWSGDKKYYIKTLEGQELLLRLSHISQYQKKKEEFEALKSLQNEDILLSKPIEFGIVNKDNSLYSLYTWLKGEDAELIIPGLSEKEQYDLGISAGLYLREIHKIPAPQDQASWKDRFNGKIDRKIASYEACEIKFHGAREMMEYIKDNRHLLDNRPQSFQHGDYHTGNMVITPEGELGIIDFNRMDYGDPWEEFNRITFSANLSPIFASGYINGHFNDKVPDLFFRLMALYIASNQLSSIPWAIPFGQDEVNTMLKQGQNIMKWYDGFKTYIPSWYEANFK